jgi:hypothetical protein
VRRRCSREARNTGLVAQHSVMIDMVLVHSVFMVLVAHMSVPGVALFSRCGPIKTCSITNQNLLNPKTQSYVMAAREYHARVVGAGFFVFSPRRCLHSGTYRASSYSCRS